MNAKHTPGAIRAAQRIFNESRPYNIDSNALIIEEETSAQELLEVLENARIALTFYREWMERHSPGRDYPFGIDCENSARTIIIKTLWKE